MNDNEMLQVILNEIKTMSRRLDTIEDSQKTMNRRLDSLEEGQKTIRRDIARVDRKMDRLSADVGDTLVYITENVGSELEMLKQAK